MKTINIELNLPEEEQDLNIKIVIRKGGEVKLESLPPTDTKKRELTADSILAEESIVEEKSSAKKKDAGEKSTKKSTGHKKVGGNFMDVEF